MQSRIRPMENGLVVHTDGGSRGNPGPAACAFIVEDENRELGRGSKFLGNTTNNQAEYAGLLLALDWINDNQELGNVKTINFILDSELIVKQINGFYKVKDPGIKKVFDEVIKKIELLKSDVKFEHVKREFNQTADFLVNQELDNHK